jgi:hypothetical protein
MYASFRLWWKSGFVDKLKGGIEMRSSPSFAPTKEDILRYNIIQRLSMIAVTATLLSSIDYLQAALGEFEKRRGTLHPKKTIDRQDTKRAPYLSKHHTNSEWPWIELFLPVCSH